MATEAKPDTRRSFSRNLLDDHLALTLSALVLCSMTIKVLVVAHGDPVTTASIASRQGLTGLAGILFAVGLPGVVNLLAFIAATSLGEALREEDSLTGPVVTLCIALLLAVIFSPQGILSVLVFYSLAMIMISWAILVLRSKVTKGRTTAKRLPFMLRKSAYPQNLTAPRLLAFAAFIALSSLVVSDSFWLPKERLTVANETVTGYVIAGDGDFTHLVLDQNRQTVVFKTSDIEKRVLCDRADDRSLPIRIFWPDRISYERCG